MAYLLPSPLRWIGLSRLMALLRAGSSFRGRIWNLDLETASRFISSASQIQRSFESSPRCSEVQPSFDKGPEGA